MLKLLYFSVVTKYIFIIGMGMLAQRYSGDEERGSAMGIALAGLAFGVLSKFQRATLNVGFLITFCFIKLVHPRDVAFRSYERKV